MLLNIIDQNLNEDQQVSLRKAVAYFRRHQFYHPESPKNNSVLSVMGNPASREIIKQLFDFLGYDFIENAIPLYYGIIPRQDVAESRSMTEMDSWVLLVLKHMFDKCFNQGDIDEYGNVITSFNDFFDELVGLSSGSSWVAKNPEIRASLNSISSRKVVHLDQKIDDNDDIPMKIRPFIRDIITFDVVNRMENFVKRKSGEDDLTEIIETPDDSIKDHFVKENNDVA